VQGIPRDTNNWAPRLGLAWDPIGDGKTVMRASYGLYYGHPLTGLVFLSDVVDGVQSPFLVVPQLTGAEDLFQGRAFTPIGGILANPAAGYLPTQQRFDPLSKVYSTPESVLTLSPILPQIIPVAGNFKYDYAQHTTFGIERQLASQWSVSADYTFIKGSNLLRPRNINQANFDLITSYARATSVCPSLPGVAIKGCASPAFLGAGGPLAGLWDALGGVRPGSVAGFGQLIFNQFRATGPNYAWANTVSGGALSKTELDFLIRQFNLPHAPGDAFVPFFSVKQYESSGSSIYHAMTLAVNRHFSKQYQLYGSWTWSHAIDDSTDLQTFEEPQDNKNTRLDRSNSTFDQRHRLVISSVLETPWKSSKDSVWKALFGDWTLAQITEFSAGRPYDLLTRNDSSLVNSGATARPSVVPANTPGSFLAPDGEAGLVQPAIGFVGDLGRNVYRTPYFSSIDLRLVRHVRIHERWELGLSTEVFNLFNRVNIRSADNSFANSGRPVSAFDARQFQFGAKLSF
jgi:hypothetical protein